MMNVAARMLTPEFLQVNGNVICSNADPMIKSNNDKTTNSAGLLQSIINPLIARLAPQRLLVISASPEHLPRIEEGQSRLVARIEATGSPVSSSIVCSTGELPFEDGAFNMLIMHDVISDGTEIEIDEAHRVLTGNGQLLLIGRGRFGIRPAHLASGIPSLNARLVCSVLRERAFLIRQCEGLGIRNRRIHLHRSWQRTALPFSDLVLIRGRHTRHKTVVTPLKFSQPQAAGVRSTAMDSLFREAV
jgi:hypothetical protein